LAFVSVLREDANIWIVWNQAVHKVDGYLVPMMILENDSPFAAATWQIDGKLHVNFTESFF
jgi:hypothetical protein